MLSLAPVLQIRVQMHNFTCMSYMIGVSGTVPVIRVMHWVSGCRMGAGVLGLVVQGMKYWP